MTTRCDTCEVMAEIRKSDAPACCKWFMDNVVCGNKSTKSCPHYKPAKTIKEKKK